MVYLIPSPKVSSNSRLNNMNKNSTSTGKSIFTFSNIILLILLLILLFFVIQLIIYVLTFCYKKKELKNYLIDLSFNPCEVKYAPTDAKNPYLERKSEGEKEVFHISNQIYTYDEAICKCRTYGGELATKEQIIDAYNHGADWCSYGWSQGQNAFYPTQKCTWDMLQKRGKGRSCGNPGVNGGKFLNKNIKFGINCYGIKPKGFVVKEKPPVCTDKEYCKLEADFQSTHKLRDDKIAPFNQNKWSIFKA